MIWLLVILAMAVVGLVTNLLIFTWMPEKGETVLVLVVATALLIGGWMAWPSRKRHWLVHLFGKLILGTVLVNLIIFGILFGFVAAGAH